AERRHLDFGRLGITAAEVLDARLLELARMHAVLAGRLVAEGRAVIAVAGLASVAGPAFQVIAAGGDGEVGPQAEHRAAGVGEDVGALADLLAGALEEDVGGLQDARFDELVA